MREPEVRDKSILTGIFDDKESAERAYNALKERGYRDDEISIMMSDDTHKKNFEKVKGKTEFGNKAMEGTGTGAAIGGTIGAVVGIIAALGTSLIIPGLGIVIAGPIAAGLAGAGAGGFTGGIIGALIGMGIPEERARLYESGIKKGKIVIGVHPRNEEDATYFENNWKTNKGEDIYR